MSSTYRPFIVVFVLCVASLANRAELLAGDWPQWRGPEFNGASTEKNLPSTFSKTEGVVWSFPMPGPSGATPVVHGDYVFVSSTDDTAKTCMAMAFDRKTGKERWRVKVAEGMGKDRMSTYSNSSPVTDGKHVWFFYGTGDLICLDLAGKEVWKRNVQKDYGQFAFQWTFSSSPVLFDGRLYLQVLQRDVPVQGRGRTDGPNESYLLALDPATGKELWKVLRPAEARQESLEAFTTPTPHKHGSRTELIIAGGDCLTGHDPATGKELWRWGTWNPTHIGHWRLVPSPTAGNGVALVCGPKNAPIYAVKLGLNGTLASEKDLAWQSFVQSTESDGKTARPLENKELSSDVASPLFYDGRFYVLNGDKKKLICVEPSGKVVWTGDLKGKTLFQCSPTAADGKIYAMNFAGEVFVVQAGGDEFKLLHMADMGEPGEDTLRASIVPSHGQLFIRTSKTLFCVAKK
jgi:outer membrane protein assembly factor BamB